MHITVTYIKDRIEIIITMNEEEVAPSVEVVEKAPPVSAEIQMIPVKSSNIASIGYRESDGTLQIKFLSTGKSYQYLSVPYYVWESLMMTESKGTFFGSEIKKVYTTIPLD